MLVFAVLTDKSGLTTHTGQGFLNKRQTGAAAVAAGQKGAAQMAAMAGGGRGGRGGGSQPNSLPAGWVAHHDPASGKYYYFNAATRQSTWTMPTAPVPAVPTPAAAPLAPAPTSIVVINKVEHQLPLFIVTFNNPAAARGRGAAAGGGMYAAVRAAVMGLQPQQQYHIPPNMRRSRKRSKKRGK